MSYTYKHKTIPVYIHIWDWNENIDYNHIIECAMNIKTFTGSYKVIEFNSGGDDFCLIIAEDTFTDTDAKIIYDKIFTDENEFE